MIRSYAPFLGLAVSGAVLLAMLFEAAPWQCPIHHPLRGRCQLRRGHEGNWHKGEDGIFPRLDRYDDHAD